MLLAKLLARFRRWLYLTRHVLTALPIVFLGGPDVFTHRAVDVWEEAHFDRPNRFGLRSVNHLAELSCECGKVFWNIHNHEGGPHD